MCCYFTTGHTIRNCPQQLAKGDCGLCSRYDSVAYEFSGKTNRMKINKTWERQALRSERHCSSFTTIIKKTDNNTYSEVIKCN